MMKKMIYIRMILLMVFNQFIIFSVRSQTCDNCGIGTHVPTSKLHIKSCNVGTSTSALNVAETLLTNHYYSCVMMERWYWHYLTCLQTPRKRS